MKFKIISLLLASGIVLAACGNDDDQKIRTTQITTQKRNRLLITIKIATTMIVMTMMIKTQINTLKHRRLMLKT
ncbi:hypothetical protein AAHB43_11780 [Staphylococcus pseudintermedius]